MLKTTALIIAVLIPASLIMSALGINAFCQAIVLLLIGLFIFEHFYYWIW